MGADFQAFDRYRTMRPNEGSSITVVPKTNPAPGEFPQYMMIDVRALSLQDNSTADATRLRNYMLEARELAEENRNQLARRPELPPIPSVREIERNLDLLRTNEDPLYTTGGGVAMGGLISLIDSRSSSLQNRLEEVFPSDEIKQFSARDEANFDIYVRHHEAAHMILDLEEPGSDFVGAVMLLKEHPEARDMLRTVADLRMVEGVMHGENAYSKYGIECTAAIEAALNLSPERIRSMSTAEAYRLGKRFDDMNDFNNTVDVSVEDRLHSSMVPERDWWHSLSLIWDRSARDEQNQIHVSAWQIGRTLDRNPPWAGTPEARLRDSLDRLEDNKSGQCPVDREAFSAPTDTGTAIGHGLTPTTFSP